MLLPHADAYPVVFVLILGLSLLLYVLLDGFDLGVGLLMPWASDTEKDLMISAIGPFWDANETWLVLGIGILLVAFPHAAGPIMSQLYIPTTLMLMGLIARGVSFDFRSKAKSPQKRLWNNCFTWGSLVTSLCQGYMLGRYIMGLTSAPVAYIFAGITAISLTGGYALLGGTWLIYKTTANLRIKMLRLLPNLTRVVILSIIAIYLLSPLCIAFISARWLHMPDILIHALIPIICLIILSALLQAPGHLPNNSNRYDWLPWAGACSVFILCFHALAFSFYPYIIPEKMDIWHAATSTEALDMILWGIVLVLPCVLSYTVMSYRVFSGKADSLSYDE